VRLFIGLTSILVGAIGAYLIYKGSPPGGGPGVVANQAVLDEIRHVGLHNKRLQRIGLVLVLLGLVGQAILLLLP
jgi:hypothetical protein